MPNDDKVPNNDNDKDKVVLTRATFEAWEKMYASRPRFLSNTRAILMWFGIPFVAMWGLGADPTIAARAAVFITVFASVGFAVTAWAILAMMRATFGLLVTLDQHEGAKRAAVKQAYDDAMAKFGAVKASANLTGDA